MTNFGHYLHERALSSTLIDAAAGTGAELVNIPAAAAALRAELDPDAFVVMSCNLSTMTAVHTWEHCTLGLFRFPSTSRIRCVCCKVFVSAPLRKRFGPAAIVAEICSPPAFRI